MNWIKIGEGDEAIAYKGNPESLEGFGGTLELIKPRTVVKRTNITGTPEDWEGPDIFCRNLTASILDNYFIKKDIYSTEHIPLPLGSFKGGYYYEFAEGSEGWPTTFINKDYNRTLIDIKENIVFINHMNSYGFNIWGDTCDALDTSSGKNVIFETWNAETSLKFGELPSCWKRIDFGSRSCPFNYETFKKRTKGKKSELESVIGTSLYKLLILAGKYGDYTARQEISDREISELETRALNFRRGFLI